MSHSPQVMIFVATGAWRGREPRLTIFGAEDPMDGGKDGSKACDCFLRSCRVRGSYPGEPAIPRILTQSNMNDDADDSEGPTRNIIWQTQRQPARCEHQHEVIAHEEGGALKRCVKCGSLETE